MPKKKRGGGLGRHKSIGQQKCGAGWHAGVRAKSVDLHHHVRIARYRSCDVRARQPPPATVGGARSRARELFCISSCTGNGHASFSCSPHSVVCGECGEGIGLHNSYSLRRRCCKSFEAFDASCRATENRLTPVVPHDGDGVDRLYPACGRVVWVPSWRGDTFWARTRVLPQLKVVLFFVSCN